MTGERPGETFGEAMDRIEAEAHALLGNAPPWWRWRARKILRDQAVLRARMDERRDAVLREHFN